ncbi:sulfatase [Zobellia galactanivorans]|uniref:sulfatase n=1 Tax=Zobellia galactanivorans (strain DSM 12802 / CCUG 47099 / CIP 106680 / NCIMB 13871 / Dsij) TaxID=63186 RepID=UPI0026E1F98E|nr:sulfatase [Zobellia galactanivorans]MDO6810470.1 sulfatase [Zobellia galactanivorans]
MLKFFSFLFIVFFMCIGLKAQESKKPNVLFIIVDDLRPELGCYGKSQVISPNIDKLSNTGMTFNRAYCNIPVCGASRASILTGLRPNSKRFVGAFTRQDEEVPGVVSLPMHFKNNGYKTISLGKVYHHLEDGMGSWSTPPWMPSGDWMGWQAYILPESHNKTIPREENPEMIHGPFFEVPNNVPDHVYPDGMVAKEAIQRLKQQKNSEEPFFMALGFVRPHLPFNAPKKYWDLYDFDDIVLPENMEKPENAPQRTMHNFGELRNYTDVPKKGPLEKDFMRKLIHGYYASISYTDAQVGKVIDELERLDIAKNTVVILLGDHGWFLGEHGLWCKHSNFEKALHTPLIVRTPQMNNSLRTDALVEFVDIYPSLCEVAGLSKPFHLQGKSFVPLLSNPDKVWKSEVYSRWVSGETIITNTHTYTEWFNEQSEKTTDRMLYDLKNDPEENFNIAEQRRNRELITELSEKLNIHVSERDKLILN